MSETDHPDPLYFPSQEWFSQYEEAINDDDAYNEMSEGWGVGFDGDLVFELRDMPVDDLDLEDMPPYLATELDEYMSETDRGYAGYAYLGLEDGRCTGARLIEGPGEVEHGFLLSASSEDWEALLRGDIDVIQGLMSGTFDLDGDMQKVLQYTDSAQRLTELASSIDAAFARERFSSR